MLNSKSEAYAAAGVDITAGYKAVELMKTHIARTVTDGVLSGIVEPIAALITIAAASAVVSVLPYLLAFAAGAMMYVVVEELIPEMSEGEHSNIGTVAFALGFVLMMILDVALAA